MNKDKRVIRKPVAFNQNDPHQKKLLDYTLTIDNFSGYMKKLIEKDYRKKRAQNR